MSTRALVLFAIAWLLCAPGTAPGSDVFNTQAQVSPGPATPLLGHPGDECLRSPPSKPLQLFEAIERTLCESPKTHSAWASVKAAAAVVGESKGAYLPTLNGTLDYSWNRDVGASSSAKDSNAAVTEVIDAESLTLGWVLYDFGGRSATLENSKQLLLAAQATQNLTLQSAFADTATQYYTAQAGHASVEALRRGEANAQRTLDAATARYRTGIAPITDQLAARTALAQAVYQRAAAEGAYRIALGTLDVSMSLSPEEPLTLPDLNDGVLPNTEFVQATHELIEEARQKHPTVLAARAQWQAAEQNVREVRAEGLPKLSLTGGVTRSNQPLSTTVGQLALPASSQEASIGLHVDIPLFLGFTQTYKIHEAQAEVEVQAQALRDAQQQVALGVWASVQTLESATENLHNTETVLQSATESFTAAEHRYQTGVGSILEVLSAQTELGGAEMQRIQAQLDWRTARMQLAQSLGGLGMWALH